MHLVLDANQYIFAFGHPPKKSCEELILKIISNPEDFLLSICRPLVTEIEAHLRPIQQREVHTFLNTLGVTIDETWIVPFDQVERYIAKGLKRGDAFVAGYTEWVGADILVSENRKDIVNHPELFPFKVTTSKDFLK